MMVGRRGGAKFERGGGPRGARASGRGMGSRGNYNGARGNGEDDSPTSTFSQRGKRGDRGQRGGAFRGNAGARGEDSNRSQSNKTYDIPMTRNLRKRGREWSAQLAGSEASTPVV